MDDEKRFNMVLLTSRPHHWGGKVPSLPPPQDKNEEVNPVVFDYQGAVIDIDDPLIREQLILRLRRHYRSCLKPIFLTTSINPRIDSLADGITEDFSEANLRAQPILERIRSLDYDPALVLSSPLFRVLLYFYVRNAHIVPVKEWFSPSIYTYPIIEVLTDFSEHVGDWLRTQTNRVLLAKGKLVDRVRRCPHCGLDNPNYIDVCTNCHSIQIQQDRFLHCFTCGAVRPEKDFEVEPGLLSCPQCSERLRHIGTDYDRPLENYSCSDCQSSFSEPLIIAVCPRCEKASAPEDLEVKNYISYHLTEKAIIAAKTGHLEEPSALMDSLQNVTFQHFVFQFNWFYSMARRYKGEDFTIFAIRATNLDELESNVGASRLLELMEEFVKRVRASLRTTDFTSRGTHNDLWFLLPKTDINQREIVINRILAFSDETQQKGDSWLKLNVSALTIPTENEENDNPDKIIALINHALEKVG